MKIEYPGLLIEKLRSGNCRYRVRVEGNPRKRIRLSVTPDDDNFLEHYRAARVGIEIKPETPAEERAIHRSVAWLVYQYLDDMERKTETGQISAKTLAARTRILHKIRDGEWRDFHMEVPRKEIIKLRDDLASTPALADKTVVELRLMYRWAAEREMLHKNPARGIGKIDVGKGGAVAWTANELRTFRMHYPLGSAPHLALTLLMFTACRIGDVVWLGRDQEKTIDGIRYLSWQPEKKGAAEVSIPMLPPLVKAINSQKVAGAAYVLKSNGKPYSSGDSLSATFVKWCREAGLANRSAHGIRKAVGDLLAEEGCTQHQIMAIHGHKNALTSEVYTKSADRRRLAADAIKKLEGMEW
ncbi:MAG: tyrosine-type recombinase/integrase [Sneathiella sp.]